MWSTKCTSVTSVGVKTSSKIFRFFFRFWGLTPKPEVEIENLYSLTHSWPCLTYTYTTTYLQALFYCNSVCMVTTCIEVDLASFCGCKNVRESKARGSRRRPVPTNFWPWVGGRRSPHRWHTIDYLSLDRCGTAECPCVRVAADRQSTCIDQRPRRTRWTTGTSSTHAGKQQTNKRTFIILWPTLSSYLSPQSLEWYNCS